MPDDRAHVAALERRIADLQRTVAQLRARETGPEWLALKACDHGPFSYEAVRDWCERGLIDARKEGGRWYVRTASLKAYLARRQRSA